MSNKTSASPQQQTRADMAAAPNRDQIQERAYYRYVERGRENGKALDDWLVAETEMRGQPSPPSES